MKTSILAVLCAMLCVVQAAAKGDSTMATGESKTIAISCNGETHTAVLADNKSARAFYALLQKGDITLDMHDYGGFEKSGELPGGKKIVRTDTHFEAVPGDFNLFMGNIVAIYYTKITYDFTKLGHIEGATEKMMQEWLKAGEGNVNVTFGVAK